MDCQRCRSFTQIGKQCSRQACLSALKCAQHLSKEDGLAVRKSMIPGAGYGLFATRNFPKNTIIGKYNTPSAYMTEKDISHNTSRSLDTSYIWCTDSTERHCWDARSSQSTIARYANGCDKPGHKLNCNAMITIHGNLKTERNIMAGQEILIAYGPDYWKYNR